MVCPYCKHDPTSPKVSHLFAGSPSDPNYNLSDAVQYTLRNAPGLIGVFSTLAAFVRGFIGAWKRPGMGVVILCLMLQGCAATTWWPWNPPQPIPQPTPKPSPISTPTPGPVPTPSPTAIPTPQPTPPPPPPSLSCPTGTPGPGRLDIAIYELARTVADVTPKVVSPEWCAEHGFPGRYACPYGPDGTPMRLGCEAILAAPYVWTLNGHKCEERSDGCWPHEEPTKLYIERSLSGHLRAVARNGASGEVEVR